MIGCMMLIVRKFVLKYKSCIHFIIMQGDIVLGAKFLHIYAYFNRLASNFIRRNFVITRR